jgi:F-box/leucine-rich repeat protein 7
MRRQPLRSSQTATQKSSDPYTLVQSFDSGVNPSRPAKSSPLGSSTIAGLPLELLDRLKAFPLFQSAPDSFLLSIGKSLRPSVFQPSQEVIKEGDDAKAMYWLVRGSVKVTSIDGESTYAELKPGAFFGEIGILMDIPRTASIVATVRSLLVRLNKEDLQKELPKYPEVENAIREEASERLAILERKKKERGGPGHQGNAQVPIAARKRSRDWLAGDVEMAEIGSLANGEILSHKRRRGSGFKRTGKWTTYSPPTSQGTAAIFSIARRHPAFPRSQCSASVLPAVHGNHTARQQWPRRLLYRERRRRGSHRHTRFKAELDPARGCKSKEAGRLKS